MPLPLSSAFAITMTLAMAGTPAVAAPTPAAASPGQTRADRARANTHYQQGKQLYGKEAFEEAAEEFRKAVAFDATFELAHYELGRSLVALKRYVEAIDAYRTSRSLFQQSVSDHFTTLQERRRRWQDQLGELEEMLRVSRLAPPTIQTQNQIRQLEDMQRRIRENMSREQGETIDTTVPAFLSLALGSAHFRAGQLAEAEVEYKATLEADPRTGEAWNNLAVIYMLTDRLADAERAVAAAEKAGFRVSQGLKDEIAKRKKR